MAEREQSKGRQRPEEQELETDETHPIERDAEADQKLDELLDEIDHVLEENSEEFVRNYVQKGGE